MIAFVPLSGKKYPILGALAHGLQARAASSPVAPDRLSGG